MRMLRLKHNLPQEVVAAWGGVSARQYGYFESGLARLAWNTIQKLKSTFEGLDKGEVVVDRARPLNLLDEEDFLSIQQNMLRSSDHTYRNLWFFGVRRLPVLTETIYQNKWAENLCEREISYNVFLVLNKPMDELTIQLLRSAVSNISAQVKASAAHKHGRINIFGLTNGEKVNVDIERQYQELQRHLKENFKGIAEATGPHNMFTSTFKACRAILLYGWLRSIVFYEDHLDANSFAAVFLDNLSNDPQCSGKGESGWTFLTRNARSDLLLHIRAFTLALSKKTKKPSVAST